MKRAPTDFDLSTSPLTGQRYIPPKTRDPRVAEQRRSLTPGELVLHQQRDGLQVARMTLQALTDPESMRFALPLISTSALNSVWYQYAESERNIADSVRRRRLKLPQLRLYASAQEVLTATAHGFELGEPIAREIIELHVIESAALDRAKRNFGNVVGTAALTGACVVPLLDLPIPGTQQRAQELSREHSLQLAEGRAELAEKIGAIPTLAQMAEPDSHLSVYWRPNAPDQAYNAYSEAQHSFIS